MRFAFGAGWRIRPAARREPVGISAGIRFKILRAGALFLISGFRRRFEVSCFESGAGVLYFSAIWELLEFYKGCERARRGSCGGTICEGCGHRLLFCAEYPIFLENIFDFWAIENIFIYIDEKTLRLYSLTPPQE